MMCVWFAHLSLGGELAGAVEVEAPSDASLHLARTSYEYRSWENSLSIFVEICVPFKTWEKDHVLTTSTTAVLPSRV